MPPRTKINRQMIIDAALQVIREQGHEQMNARTIAEELNCSTQPVMYHFRTIDEIRAEAYRKADAFHSAFISPKGDRDVDPLLELGLNYIRFGYEQKNLFRFLFQTNGFDGLSMMNLMSNPAISDLIRMVAAGMGCSVEEAKETFFSLFVSAHGIASLLANNAMEYEEETFQSVLENAYRSVKNRRERREPAC